MIDEGREFRKATGGIELGMGVWKGVVGVVKFLDGFEQSDLVGTGGALKIIEGLLTDGAARDVDDALERDLIAGVGDEAGVGEDVFYFAAFVEGGAADQFVAYAGFDEFGFEGARLGVGAVHNGDFVGVVIVGIDQVRTSLTIERASSSRVSFWSSLRLSDLDSSFLVQIWFWARELLLLIRAIGGFEDIGDGAE